jgi:hypothetical protein
MARQPVDVHTRVATEADDTSRRAGAIGVALALALVAASMAWALVLVGRRVDLHLSGGPPLIGRYEPRFPAAALAPVLSAACVLWRAPALARRLSWRPLLGVATASAGIWAVLLAGSDGIGAFGLPLTSPFEYLRDVGRFHDLNEFLGTFTAHVSEESAGFQAVAVARQGWSGGRPRAPRRDPPRARALPLVWLGPDGVACCRCRGSASTVTPPSRRCRRGLVCRRVVRWAGVLVVGRAGRGRRSGAGGRGVARPAGHVLRAGQPGGAGDRGRTSRRGRTGRAGREAARTGGGRARWARRWSCPPPRRRQCCWPSGRTCPRARGSLSTCRSQFGCCRPRQGCPAAIGAAGLQHSWHWHWSSSWDGD